MNRLLILVLSVLIFCSCNEYKERNERLSKRCDIIEEQIYNNTTQLRNLESEKEFLESDINNLISKKRILESDINNLISEKESLESDINNLISKKEYLESDKSNDSIKFMICIKIHQKTFTINILEAAKNKMNDVIIWFETSESYYKSYKIGDTLVNSF